VILVSRLRWTAHYDGVVGYISDNHRASANQSPSAEPQTLAHARSESHMRFRTYLDRAAQDGSAGDVRVRANGAFVLDDGAGVDDGVAPQGHPRAQDSPSQHHRSGMELSARADHCAPRDHHRQCEVETRHLIEQSPPGSVVAGGAEPYDGRRYALLEQIR
jgi:hypothetical protein